MSKGSRVDQFSAGQHVQYKTDVGHKVFKKELDEDGHAIFAHNVHIERVDTGRIVKLHRSGRQGAAEIRPDGGSKKVTRRLQHVDAA